MHLATSARNLLIIGALLGLPTVANSQTPRTPPKAEEVYSLAREAYLYAYPIVSMETTMRQATNVPDAAAVNMRAPVNQFAHARAYTNGIGF